MIWKKGPLACTKWQFPLLLLLLPLNDRSSNKKKRRKSSKFPRRLAKRSRIYDTQKKYSRKGNYLSSVPFLSFFVLIEFELLLVPLFFLGKQNGEGGRGEYAVHVRHLSRSLRSTRRGKPVSVSAENERKKKRNKRSMPKKRGKKKQGFVPGISWLDFGCWWGSAWAAAASLKRINESNLFIDPSTIEVGPLRRLIWGKRALFHWFHEITQWREACMEWLGGKERPIKTAGAIESHQRIRRIPWKENRWLPIFFSFIAWCKLLRIENKGPCLFRCDDVPKLAYRERDLHANSQLETPMAGWNGETVPFFNIQRVQPSQLKFVNDWQWRFLR